MEFMLVKKVRKHIFVVLTLKITCKNKSVILRGICIPVFSHSRKRSVPYFDRDDNLQRATICSFVNLSQEKYFPCTLVVCNLSVICLVCLLIYTLILRYHFDSSQGIMGVEYSSINNLVCGKEWSRFVLLGIKIPIFPKTV